MWLKRTIVNYLVALAALGVGVLCIEGALRVYQSMKWNTGILDTHGKADVPDDRLGWKPKAHQVFERKAVDASGDTYNIRYRTSKYGFREWQDNDSGLIRILFLGDSYTRALDVSNNTTYYQIFADIMPSNVFAFGGSGYGTLQQYFVLDRYITKIRPDLIIWQFAPNDTFDNDFALEQRFGGNLKLTRPYLINGQVEYRSALPEIHTFFLEIAEMTSSRLLRLVFERITLASMDPRSLYSEIASAGLDHPDLRRSRQTTIDILQMAKKRVNGIPIIAFNVSNRPIFYQNFQMILQAAEIPEIERVPAAIRALEHAGIEIRAEDGYHWNDAGHQIAGLAIASYLSEFFEPSDVMSESVAQQSHHSFDPEM